MKQWSEIFTPNEIKQGEILLNQQMWCFGCDIRNSPNLLIKYGCTREKPNPQAASYYLYTDKNGTQFALYGSGIFVKCSKIGSIYMSRFQFAAYTANMQNAPTSPSEITNLKKVYKENPEAELIWRLFAFLENYEQWITRRMGASYRKLCIQAWQYFDKQTYPAKRMPQIWRKLNKNGF